LQGAAAIPIFEETAMATQTTVTPAPQTAGAARSAPGAAAGERIRNLWDRLAPLPGGKRLFSWLLGRAAPYTGTVGAQVVELRRGYVRVELPDRKKVRNHLRSIHAIALMNVAEMASGLGAVYTMEPGLRGIITHLEIDYLKKARGRITAECEFPELSGLEKREEHFEVRLTDPAGETVAVARARWLIGP
jgi:acyl-coenzyme A thioesterase PaaI-like protein